MFVDDYTQSNQGNEGHCKYFDAILGAQICTTNCKKEDNFLLSEGYYMYIVTGHWQRLSSHQTKLSNLDQELPTGPSPPGINWRAESDSVSFSRKHKYIPCKYCSRWEGFSEAWLGSQCSHYSNVSSWIRAYGFRNGASKNISPFESETEVLTIRSRLLAPYLHRIRTGAFNYGWRLPLTNVVIEPEQCAGEFCLNVRNTSLKFANSQTFVVFHDNPYPRSDTLVNQL